MSRKVGILILVIFLQICLLGGIIYSYQNILNTGKRVLVKTIFFDPRDVFRGDYVRLTYDISRYTGENLSGILEVNDKTNLYRINKPVYVVPRFSGEYVIGIDSILLSKPTNVPLFMKAKISTFNPDNVVLQVKVNTTTGEIIKSFPYNSWGETYSTGESVTVFYDLPDSFYEKCYGSGSGDCKTFTGDSTFNQDSRITSVSKLTDSASYGRFRTIGTIIGVLKFGEITLDYGVDRFFVKEGTGRDIEKKIREDNVYASWKVGKDGNILIEGLNIEGTMIK